MNIVEAAISLEELVMEHRKMKNPEILTLVPDHLKTKDIRNYAVIYIYMFLINIKLKKCVIKVFQKMVER